MTNNNKLGKDIIKFLQDHRDLIDNKEFTQLYFYAQNYLGDKAVFIITEALLSLPNLNPLDYMGWVPNSYLNSSDISHVEIPTTIKSVGSSAFRNTKNLIEIVFPHTVKDLDRNIFLNSNVKRVSLILSEVEKLPSGTFIGCEYLEVLDIPRSLKYIDEICFDTYVQKLKTIHYDGRMEDFEKIVWNSLPNCKFEVVCTNGILTMDGRSN